ncbi:MAG: class I SAM-dependent methyltransferase [Patescibacteria group bacterium]|nr:class I SAM-dependent methyltransferase [Patescibacteria group bacterium]MDD4304244.1 class I SAM-dependent methyltransferase [Patescibacteria group bacterium]MDD4695298.1 class I SAM-dependent methyltransferase [Patescibacteria group bacterium]
MIDFIVSKRQMIIQSFVSLRKKKILEVACGSGHLTRSLLTGDNFVLGIDPNTKSIEIAKKVAPKAAFMTKSFEDFSPGERQFDLVIFSIGLHEMENQEELIMKAKKIVTQSNGNVLIIERDITTQFFNVINKINPSIIEDEFKKVSKTSEILNSLSPINIGILPNIMHFQNAIDFWKICLNGDKKVTIISIVEALNVKLNQGFYIEDNMIMYLL